MDIDARYETAKRREREMRWLETGKARVSHPKYGSIIVPHGSKIMALENAAELWGCDLLEIIKEAEVWAVEPDAGPVVRPKEFDGQ